MNGRLSVEFNTNTVTTTATSWRLIFFLGVLFKDSIFKEWLFHVFFKCIHFSPSSIDTLPPLNVILTQKQSNDFPVRCALRGTTTTP